MLRRHELDVVLGLLATHGRTGCSLLEIGGGQGWQASDLAAAGFRVRSIDVEDQASVFPVEVYDGHHVPLEDAACDIVFSSNVLEHIPHVEAFQKEIHRVLRTGGLAIHIMPTTTWRMATLLGHYPWLVRAATSIAVGDGGSDTLIVNRAASQRSGLQLLSRLLLAPRHGETGNAISELWHFRSRRWIKLFERSGWEVVAHCSGNLFYTGYNLLGPTLDIRKRGTPQPCLWLVGARLRVERISRASYHFCNQTAQGRSVPPKIALITGITGQDGAHLARLLLDQGLYRAWREAPLVIVQHGARRRPLRRPARARHALLHALRRHDGRDQPHPPHPGAPAGRDLQSRGAKPRAGQLRDAGIHGQLRRARHAAPARGHPHPRHQGQGALLPGVDLGAVRQGAGDSAEARRRRSTRARPTARPSSTPTGSR